MSEELKPCPFCGGEAELRSDFKDPVCRGHEHNHCLTAVVRCGWCGADGTVVDSCSGQQESDAIKAWNRRESDWISVEDRLPQLGTWVFISDGAGTHFSAFVNHLGFVGADGEAFDSAVTHWMPLPDPSEVKP